ncbi:MAG: hypothetical protein PVH00_01485 [Gemmatimonadota bacterium]|jgi:hypothetical protein
MTRIALWFAGAALGVFLLDRLLLFFESRGWIYYRTTGLHRGAATYHLLELSSVFDPGFKEIMEIRNEDQEQQDESGDPPAPPDPDDPDRSATPPLTPL